MSRNMENTAPIKIDDFVWAKMDSFPPWPARVQPPARNAPAKPVLKDPTDECWWVYFFGSRNYGWVKHSQIKPYEQYKEKFCNGSKLVQFKEAISEIEDILLKIKNNPEYVVNLPDYVGDQKRSSPKKKRSIGGAKRGRKSNDMSISPVVKKARSSISVDENSATESEGSERTSSFLSDSRSETYVSDGFEIVNTKDLPASYKSFGFLGLGNIGKGIVKNLITSGHKVNLWNRTESKYEDVTTYGGHLNLCESPREVVQKSDITFSCLSDSDVVLRIMQEYLGADDDSDEVLKGKGYVEMTGIGPVWSKNIREMVETKGGVFLEAQIQGSRTEASDGNLILLCAGNKNLYLQCQSCFKAMASSSHFLGEVGYASKSNIILSLIKGVYLTTIAEGFALADRCGISLEQFLKIFNLTSLASPYASNKADIIVKKKFSQVEQALQYMQKDLKLAADLSDALKQPINLTVTANEIFKHARRLGYDGHDASCIYMRTRH